MAVGVAVELRLVDAEGENARKGAIHVAGRPAVVVAARRRHVVRGLFLFAQARKEREDEVAELRRLVRHGVRGAGREVGGGAAVHAAGRGRREGPHGGTEREARGVHRGECDEGRRVLIAERDAPEIAREAHVGVALEDVLARRGTVGGRRPLIDENAAFKGEEGLEAVGKLLFAAKAVARGRSAARREARRRAVAVRIGFNVGVEYAVRFNVGGRHGGGREKTGARRGGQSNPGLHGRSL